MKKTGESARTQHQASRQAAPPQAALPAARYLFFGGKGGVGKTTAAAATALYLLDHARPGEQILLLSTDPAHSLSDSLNVKLGDHPIEVARRGRARLVAREMDAAAALDQFKGRHGSVLAEIADRGTLLDKHDIDEMLSLSLPGLDEAMALFELSELEPAAAYSRIVVDTAPSGHTARLLRLPEVFARWTAALDRMAEKHRFMVAQFVRGRRQGEDAVDLFLRELDERIKRLRAILHDPARAAFVLVTIPEAMAFEETARYLRFLRDEGLPATSLIINRVEQEHHDCPYCRTRAAGQKPWLKRMADGFKALSQHRVPLFAEAVQGVEGLRHFARLAWDDAEPGAVFKPGNQAGATLQARQARMQPPVNHARRAAAQSARAAAQSARAAGVIEDFNRRVLIFGGKGGVGKTTAAAASALALAEQNPQARVLVFSTDPAHSLADSFAAAVGELKRGVARQQNLDAMEIDPMARFAQLQQRYQRVTDDLFASLTAGSRWEIQFDREAMREIVALAPPGIDEIMALGAISHLVEENAYTTIVLDTAPTGHLVRFLELPAVALSWVRQFIKLLLKYKDVVRWGGIAEELVSLSKSIKRVAALLADAGQCEFIGVAIPERMSLEETARLTGALKRLKIPMRGLLVNNVIPKEAARVCRFCAARRRAQQEVIGDYKNRFKPLRRLFIAPQQPHAVRGRAQLRAHFANWHRLKDAE